MDQGWLPGTDEVLIMGNGEVDKIYVIRNFLEGRIKRAQAAQCLKLSERQVTTLAARVHERGTVGVIHGLRGRPSNHRLDLAALERALCALHSPRWENFGPTFAQEQLLKRCGLRLGIETVRQLLILVELWEPGRRKAKHRAWRERRRCIGMLVQLDGSDHDWFEGRGPRCVLIIFIDDATSRILYGEFVDVEDTHTLFRTTRVYLERFGRPVALYVDKDSIYTINRQSTIEEELRNADPLTQYARAMKQLAVEIILAHSPQAKGRVERGFGTHQDRLVKELRLRGISDKASANQYLWNEYLPEHNDRFAVDPADPADAHRPLSAGHNLDDILAFHTPRQVQNDYTVRYKNRFYQLLSEQPVVVRNKDEILVVERLDGFVGLAFKGRYLNAELLKAKPYRPQYYQHPRLRSVRPGELLPADEARPHSPLPDPWKTLDFDPVAKLREQARREASLRDAPLRS
jgi:hypothetical protein